MSVNEPPFRVQLFDLNKLTSTCVPKGPTYILVYFSVLGVCMWWGAEQKRKIILYSVGAEFCGSHNHASSQFRERLPEFKSVLWQLGAV